MLVLVERRPDRRQFSADELTSSADICRASPDVNLVHQQAQFEFISAAMRWLQLRFNFDSTAVRLLIKGH